MHELCDAAARETMPLFRTSVAVDNKLGAGFDPVTEADRRAEIAIRALINREFPDHGVIGEEGGNDRADAELCWHIDPVDGTRAFICGLPTWGTLIGLARQGRIIAGVMQQPFTGERFLAAGDGSWLVHEGQRTRLTTNPVTDLSKAVMMSTSPFLFDENRIGRYRALEGRMKMTRYGFDCYAYAMLAAGHISLVVESGLHSYDVAALIAIIEAAGGVFTTWDGGNALAGGAVIAAANAEIHRQALEILNG